MPSLFNKAKTKSIGLVACTFWEARQKDILMPGMSTEITVLPALEWATTEEAASPEAALKTLRPGPRTLFQGGNRNYSTAGF